MAKKRAHVFISGRVQGVFFRSYTQREAQRLGLTGWVRNTYDGQVEACFEGDEDPVNQMIAWCYVGSPYSVVEDVQVQWEEYKGEFGSFAVRGL